MPGVYKCNALSVDETNPDEALSEIQQFYSGSSLFITGASGFIGQLLTEKLLRSCPDIGHVYLLMREKKGKRINERFDEIFNDVLYDRLRLEHPKFREKITLIPGDCEQSNMGLSQSDLELIRSKVDIVFHVAATVRFDEKLRKAVAINLSCVKDLLSIAKTMTNLKAYIHVSTAFANCLQTEMKEVFYDVPITCDKLIDICDTLDDLQLETLTPQILGDWPNSYSFTKAIAENALKVYGQNLPLTIVRPSIVISTAREPMPGWINNFAGPIGISAGVYLGLFHLLHLEHDFVGDLVPADYTVNNIIAAGWQVGTATRRGNLNDNVARFEDIELDENIPIYFNSSWAENPITWRKYIDTGMSYGKNYLSTLSIWHHFVLVTSNRYVYLVGIFFMHLIPGFLADCVCRCIGKEPRVLKGYKKIHKFIEIANYFMLREFHFHNNNTQALWKTLNATDRRLFDFNIAGLDWNQFFTTYVSGARVYLLKDPLETVPQGIAKNFKLKIAHYTLLTFLTFALIKLVLLIFNIFF